MAKLSCVDVELYAPIKHINLVSLEHAQITTSDGTTVTVKFNQGAFLEWLSKYKEPLPVNGYARPFSEPIPINHDDHKRAIRKILTKHAKPMTKSDIDNMLRQNIGIKFNPSTQYALDDMIKTGEITIKDNNYMLLQGPIPPEHGPVESDNKCPEKNDG